MQTITTIGLDIAKSVFQVHGVDDAGQVVIRRQLNNIAAISFGEGGGRASFVAVKVLARDNLSESGNNVA